MRLNVETSGLKLGFDGSSAEFAQGVLGLVRLMRPDSFTANEPIQSAYIDSDIPSVPAAYLLPPSHHASAIVSQATESHLSEVAQMREMLTTLQQGGQLQSPAPQPSELDEMRAIFAAFQQEIQSQNGTIDAEYRAVEQKKALSATKGKRSWISVPLVAAVTFGAIILGGGLSYLHRTATPSEVPENTKAPEPGKKENRPALSPNKVVCVPLPATKPPDCKKI